MKELTDDRIECRNCDLKVYDYWQAKDYCPYVGNICVEKGRLSACNYEEEIKKILMKEIKKNEGGPDTMLELTDDRIYYYDGFYVYYDDECGMISIYERYGWEQDKVRDICYVKNADKYRRAEVNFFVKMLIDTLPIDGELSRGKEWDMDEWIGRIRGMMN